MTFRRASRYAMTSTLLAAMLALTGCASTTTSTPAANLAVAAQAEADLSTFNQLVQQAGLQDALKGGTPVTVFAPSNEAFKALPATTLEALSKDPAELQRVLKHHVVPGVHTQASVTGTATLDTLAETKLPLSKAGEFLTVEDGLVIKGDVQTGNGVLHIIDSVLMPPKKK